MFLFLLFIRKKEISPYEQPKGNVGKSVIPKNQNCNAPHTRKSQEDPSRCECNPGYPSGDPSLATGCYRCYHECAEYATCSYPGKCLCNPGYSGNGNEHCQAIPPVFISIQPEYAMAYKKFISNVTFETDPKANFTKAFLKIRSDVYKCKLLTQGIFNCTIPKMGRPGIVEMHLSFDNSTWSEEYVEFQIMSPEIADTAVYVLIVLIIAGVSLAILRTKRKVNRGDSIIPFLKKVPKL